MKENDYMDLIGYKIKIFVTKDFCILSFLVIVCVVFLLLFVFNIRIYVDLNNKICDNINSILVSLTSGYLVSYFVYLLTVHIPSFAQTIINDRIICNHLSSYRNKLLYSFGGLMYKLKGQEEGKEVVKIPEITRLFESHDEIDKFMVKIIQSTYNSESKNMNNLLLVKNFERLEDSFQNLLNLNAFYKSRFSHEIFQLQTSIWTNILFIIKDELRDPKTGFSMLNDSETKSLISRNFDLANSGATVYTLINTDESLLYSLYKTIKCLCKKAMSQINRIIKSRGK